MKTCTKCKVELPLDRFVKDKKRKDNRFPSCKGCRAVYYQQNREKILAQIRSYRDRPEFLAQVSRQHAEYAARRFFFIRANNLRARAKRRDQTATTAEISRLWKQQRGTCIISGRRLNRDNAQLDHIIPLKRGGSDLIDNLRWVHRDVNYAKRDLMDYDFYRLCRDVLKKQASKPKRRNGDSQGEFPWLPIVS